MPQSIGIGNIWIEDVLGPTIEQQPTEGIVRLTASVICGTDLNLIRGTFSDVTKGQTQDHEKFGVVEQVGTSFSTMSVGQRVIIPSIVGCETCR